MKNRLPVIAYLRHNPILSALVGVVFILISVYYSDIPTMILSPGWPTTEGVITSRRLIGQKFKEYDGDYYTYIEGYVRYQYSINGEPYSSSRVNSIDTLYYPSNLAVQYTVGQEVVVYYNPRNPARAVLEPGFIYNLMAFDIFSLIILIAGFYLIYKGVMVKLKRYRYKDPSYRSD
jgi:hypothetical protein